MGMASERFVSAGGCSHSTKHGWLGGVQAIKNKWSLNLVGGTYPSEKSESQLGLLYYYSQYMEKMLQTTNQHDLLTCSSISRVGRVDWLYCWSPHRPGLALLAVGVFRKLGHAQGQLPRNLGQPGQPRTHAPGATKKTCSNWGHQQISAVLNEHDFGTWLVYMDNLWIYNLWMIYGYGWWYTYPSEKSELVSWEVGMIIPRICENK